MEEAAVLYRQIAAVQPEVFMAEFLISLCAVAKCLCDFDPGGEAVTILQEIDKLRPDIANESIITSSVEVDRLIDDLCVKVDGAHYEQL